MNNYFRMSNPIPILKKDSHTIEFKPEIHSFSLGCVCSHCQQKILHHESITPCRCYSYAHQQCLTKQLNDQNPHHKSPEVHCKQCSSAIKVSTKLEINFKPNMSVLNVVGFILSLVGMVLCCYFLRKNRDSISTMMSLAVVFLMAIILCFFLIFSCNLVFRKMVFITKVHSTGLELKISAFDNIKEMEKDRDEITQT